MTPRRPAKTPEEYIDIEGRMQKWRKLTPIGLIVNLMASFAGMGAAGWLGIHLVTTFEQELQTINRKIDNSNAIVVQKIDEYAQKENADILLLTQKESLDVLALNQKIYECCAKIKP